MGKQRKKAYTYKEWKQNSEDGRFLAKLSKSCELSPAAMPSLIKECYPHYKKYKIPSFAAGLRRLKAKFGLNRRTGSDKDGAYTLGSKDNDGEDEDDEEFEEVKAPATFTRNSFIDDEVKVVAPPLAVVSTNSSLKSPPYAYAPFASASIACMPSGAQSIVQHPSVSQTCVKMDFPVEHLTEDCWDLIGDPDTGVRMLVVDLEQATENEEYKQASFE